MHDRRNDYGNGAVAKTLSVLNTMKRLSLEELKAQKANVVANLDAIKGGDAAECHNGSCEPKVQEECGPCCQTAKNNQGNPLVYLICAFINLF